MGFIILFGPISAGPGVAAAWMAGLRVVCWEACMAGGEGKRGSSGKVFVVAGMAVAAPLLTVVVVLLCLVILVVAILQSDYGLGTRCVTGSSSWVDWAVSVAKDDKHGYSQPNRGGDPDYDCSSFVWAALRHAGFDVGSSPFNTDGMDSVLKAAGFERSDFRDVASLQAGDVVWADGHTEIYMGDGEFVDAWLERCDEIARGVHYREDVPIRDLFETDLDHMLPLPPSMFDACDWRGVKADRTGTVTIDSNRYLAGPKWHSMRLMAGVRALRVELRSMDGEPIVTLERRWGRSPDTAMDPLSLLAIIARKPRSWGESPIRSDFPEETRVLLDRMEPRERGLLVDDIRHAAVVSGFRAAVMAVVEIVAAGRRPDRAAIDQTARRIAQGDGPESRARLDTYSRFMREDGDE